MTAARGYMLQKYTKNTIVTHSSLPYQTSFKKYQGNMIFDYRKKKSSHKVGHNIALELMNKL